MSVSGINFSGLATGIDTDWAVAVVPVLRSEVNDGLMKRDSTVTLPLEKTFANPGVKAPLLCVLIVAEPEGGIRNERFGCEMASGIRLPLL